MVTPKMFSWDAVKVLQWVDEVKLPSMNYEFVFTLSDIRGLHFRYFKKSFHESISELMMVLPVFAVQKLLIYEHTLNSP